MNHITIKQLAHQFQVNGQSHFTGELCARSPKGKTWHLYFLLGRLIWATGSYHRFRRWRCGLAQYCPDVYVDSLTLPNRVPPLWEYTVLLALVRRQQAEREQVAQLIEQMAIEVLFDILQEGESFEQMESSADAIKNLGQPLVILNSKQILQETYKFWEQWCSSDLARYSPHSAPFLKQAEELRQRTSPKTYQMLSRLVNGNTTLAELSVAMKQSTLAVTRSLAPYFAKGLMGLKTVPDLPPPSANGETDVRESTPNAVTVVCIDDSPKICQTMEAILHSVGYKAVSVQDSLQALPTLLEHKPALIFLDLVMPIASGYEICAQIRRVALFQDTPVVILTGNDGIVDRVRAKIVGASDFLTKPIEPKKVLSIARRYAPLRSPSDSPPKSAMPQSTMVSKSPKPLTEGGGLP